MSQGFLTIFRRRGKAEPTPESRLTTALFGPSQHRPAPPEAPLPSPPALSHPRAVISFDATSSRQPAWDTSTALTDTLMVEMPGQLAVALAVHGGSKMHTFTAFERDAHRLRDCAAGIQCQAGTTRILDIFARTLKCDGVKVLIYIGDSYEESDAKGIKLASELAGRGTRIIILDDSGGTVPIFHELAGLTGGCVLPFDASALPRMKELLAAIAMLAVGGTELLAAKQATVPAARLLLEHLKR